jgi:hypothetical protein
VLEEIATLPQINIFIFSFDIFRSRLDKSIDTSAFIDPEVTFEDWRTHLRTIVCLMMRVSMALGSRVT